MPRWWSRSAPPTCWRGASSIAGCTSRRGLGWWTPPAGRRCPAWRPEEAGPLDLLFVCAGGNATAFRDRATLAWLRYLASRGVRVGGVSGGPIILARAGIMDGYHMTVHWEHAPAVAEAYPNIMLTRSIYIVDRNRLTCAGGTAPLDMMHALIAEAHGPELARKVSDWFMHTDIRPGQSAQRASLTERYGVHDDRLTAALELMESHPGEPLEPCRHREARRAFNAATRPAVRGEAGRELCRALSPHQARARARPAAAVRRADHRDRAGLRLFQCQPFQPRLSRGVWGRRRPRSGRRSSCSARHRRPAPCEWHPCWLRPNVRRRQPLPSASGQGV